MREPLDPRKLYANPVDGAAADQTAARLFPGETVHLRSVIPPGMVYVIDEAWLQAQIDADLDRLYRESK